MNSELFTLVVIAIGGLSGMASLALAAYLHIMRGREVELALSGGLQSHVEASRAGGLYFDVMRVVHHGYFFMHRGLEGEAAKRMYPNARFDQISPRDYFLYRLAAALSLLGVILMGGGYILGRATGMIEETIF
ncbi:MAG: hypothetical protein CMN28_15870 [Salinisphaeraceae bacterium]|nr:hypothetical protein [Salinisphaeraceae bacterium]